MRCLFLTFQKVFLGDWKGRSYSIKLIWKAFGIQEYYEERTLTEHFITLSIYISSLKSQWPSATSGVLVLFSFFKNTYKSGRTTFLLSIMTKSFSSDHKFNKNCTMRSKHFVSFKVMETILELTRFTSSSLGNRKTLHCCILLSYCIFRFLVSKFDN